MGDLLLCNIIYRLSNSEYSYRLLLIHCYDFCVCMFMDQFLRRFSIKTARFRRISILQIEYNRNQQNPGIYCLFRLQSFHFFQKKLCITLLIRISIQIRPHWHSQYHNIQLRFYLLTKNILFDSNVKFFYIQQYQSYTLFVLHLILFLVSPMFEILLSLDYLAFDCKLQRIVQKQEQLALKEPQLGLIA